MRKRLHVAALLTLAAMLAVLAWNHSAEPTYQAKPLSYWMLLNARHSVPGQPNPAVAIAAIGSKFCAVPAQMGRAKTIQLAAWSANL